MRQGSEEGRVMNEVGVEEAGIVNEVGVVKKVGY